MVSVTGELGFTHAIVSGVGVGIGVGVSDGVDGGVCAGTGVVADVGEWVGSGVGVGFDDGVQVKSRTANKRIMRKTVSPRMLHLIKIGIPVCCRTFNGFIHVIT